MRSSAKKRLVWKLKTWTLVCSPIEFQILRQCVQVLLQWFWDMIEVLTTGSLQVCYLMPSSSPRCAQFPRAQDKVHFYVKLKELRDQMKGVAPRSDVQETQYSFDLQLAKGKQPSSSPVPVGLTFSRLQCCFCLQKMPRGWPSKRSRMILSMRAAAGCSASPPPEPGRRHVYWDRPAFIDDELTPSQSNWLIIMLFSVSLFVGWCVWDNVFPGVLQIWTVQQKYLF